MSSTKDKLKSVIDAQPEDASYDEIVRELVFERMIERGMNDVRNGNVITDADLDRRIRSWQK